MDIVLLSNIIHVSNHRKCVSLSSQKSMTQSTLINFHPNEYSQEYYPFAVKLDRYVASCNTLNDLSNKVCVPNKKVNFNLSVFIFPMLLSVNENSERESNPNRIQLLNELSYPFHLTYSLSPVLFITFLFTFAVLFCKAFEQFLRLSDH